ncbi:hypothetical protein [Streptomyces sp. NPDC090445]
MGSCTRTVLAAGAVVPAPRVMVKLAKEVAAPPIGGAASMR